MAGKSNYLESLLLNWCYNAAAMPTAPATAYVGLFTSDPTDTGAAGTEVTTTIRAAGRVAASFGTVTTAAGANTIANDAIVDFGDADAAVLDITHFATFDAASGGNMLHSNTITGGPVDVALGTEVKFQVGSLVVSEE
jgi:hypothetical protein